MNIEVRETRIVNLVHWVTDNEGKKHICHDPIYADWLERRFKIEREEKNNAKNLLVKES